jgi:hypothetical protein
MNDYQVLVPAYEQFAKISGVQPFGTVVFLWCLLIKVSSTYIRPYNSVRQSLDCHQLLLDCAAYLRQVMPYVTCLWTVITKLYYSELIYSFRQITRNRLLVPLLGGASWPYLQVSGIVKQKRWKDAYKVKITTMSSCTYTGIWRLLGHRAKSKAIAMPCRHWHWGIGEPMSLKSTSNMQNTRQKLASS